MGEGPCARRGGAIAVAGDWIKFDTATIDKPEVWNIADALNKTPEAVIGHLLRFWVWADRQSRDGNALVTQISRIDHIANCTGFGDALLSTGWLVKEKGGYSIPNFDRHNGKSAKKRALTKNRVETHRGKNGNAPVNAHGVTKALPEKRREVPITNTVVTRKRPVDKPARTATTEGPAPFTALMAKAIAKGEVTPELKQLEESSEPTDQVEPTSQPAPRGNGQIPEDWAETTDGIEHAGHAYGMQRLAFETDEAYAQRIEARRALG